jgi:YggT family protein
VPTLGGMLLHQLIDLYSLIIIGAVLVSWTELRPDNPVVKFLRSATEPVLEPIRRILPKMGGIDLSPIVVLIGLRLLGGIL